MVFRKYFLVIPILLAAFSASADTIGQNQSFFISPQYDAKSRTATEATLRHISERAYFYVANDYWDSISQTMQDQVLVQVDSLAEEFDNRIYPVETRFFGSEPNPGVDNDPRITILLAPLIENAGGYFDTANEYPKLAEASSNEREMIYLNVSSINNQAKMRSFLAHEFQHLISFNQKEKLRGVADDIWINELRSDYAVTLLGYNDNFAGSHLERRSRALSEEPFDSLTEWKNKPADYGQIGMFGEYVAANWSPQVIADTLKSSKGSIASLNEALAGNGFSDTFLDVYRGWLLANILNDSSDDPRFSYARSELKNFRVVPTKVINNLGDEIILVTVDSFKDWQGKWYDISDFARGENGILKIDFSSPSVASFEIVYIVFNSDGSKRVYTFNPKPNSSTLYLAGAGSDASRVIVIPIKKDKLAGFGFNEQSISLTFSVERIAILPDGAGLSSPEIALTTPSVIPNPLPVIDREIFSLFPDGTLIRARGDFKVYVIKGNWRRHIIDQRIFGFYPGLGFDRVNEVEPAVLNKYQESNLVRYHAGQQVYTIENGQRRWLDVSAQQFAASGRSWDAIFTINLPELQFYKIGANIGQ